MMRDELTDKVLNLMTVYGIRGTRQTCKITLQRSVHGIRRHSISYL